MGDRRGSRESKGASLRKSKKNPGGRAAREKTEAKARNSGTFSAPAPEPDTELYFDTGVALLSRQFDRDRERVIARAKQDGDCCGMLVWFADIEKQSMVAELCKNFSGSCYFSTGIHPDNIARTNKKSHDEWLAKVEEHAKQAECVAILSGLNLSHEVSTHFAQESLLKSSCALAEKLELPIVLHINNAASLLRTIEILRAEGFLRSPGDDEEEAEEADSGSICILLHDAMTCCEASLDHFKSAADYGMYFLLAATGLTDSSEEQADLHARAQACVSQLPIEQILLCTDSPWKTPQNIPDAYLCTLRNEPSNIASIAVAVSEARNADLKELSQQIRTNTIEVLGLVGGGVDVAEVAQDVKVMKIRFADTEKVDIAATQSPPQMVRKSPKAAPKVAPNKASYSCVRCRARLFSGADIKAHSTSTANNKTVFKVGEEGLCASTLLFKHSDSDARSGTSAGNKAVAIRANSVECAECSNKLGKLYLTETNCGCGAIVQGPVIKIAASKVDYSDGTVQTNLQDLQELALRALLENAELQLQEAALAAEEAKAKPAGPTKDKKKKHKYENRGNYSLFRDKTFIRGASRVGKKGNSLELLQETLGVKGTEGSGGDSNSSGDER